mmetsp:Transcript_75478/g.194553  ORF Transcript_75478/g.194553 Transcript_75478/m.194553 type:complete len:108 (-) Transcript_75478:439-762(-)
MQGATSLHGLLPGRLLLWSSCPGCTLLVQFEAQRHLGYKRKAQIATVRRPTDRPQLLQVQTLQWPACLVRVTTWRRPGYLARLATVSCSGCAGPAQVQKLCHRRRSA